MVNGLVILLDEKKTSREATVLPIREWVRREELIFEKKRDRFFITTKYIRMSDNEPCAHTAHTTSNK